jgi:hypothetical protein
MSPNAGGTPEAMAMPMHKGSATKKTTMDARKSLANVCLKSASPGEAVETTLLVKFIGVFLLH